MKSWGVSFLLLHLLSCVQGGNIAKYLYNGQQGAENVIEYTPDKDFKKSPAPKLVVFYSPYCSHCINYAPRYMKMAREMTVRYPQAEFWAVSCKAHRDVCAQHEIRGYPSIHSFKAGSEKSTHLGASTNEKQVIKALELDKPISEPVRKLATEVDEEDDSEEDDEDDNDEQSDENDTEEENEDDSDEDEDDQSDEIEDDESEDASEPGDENAIEGLKALAEDTDTDADEDEDSEEEDSDDKVEQLEAKLKAPGRLRAVADDVAAHPDDELGSSKADLESEEDEDDSEGEVNDDSEEDASDALENGDVPVPVALDVEEDDSDADIEDSEVNKDDSDVDQDDSDLADETEDEPELNIEDSDADELDEMDEDTQADSKVGDSEGLDEDEHEDEDESDTDEELAENKRKRARKQFDSPPSDDFGREGAPRDAPSLSDAFGAYEAKKLSDAGAQKGKKGERDMDKWREFIAEKRETIGRLRKKRLEKKKKTTDVEGGATKTMKAHTPGTEEYSSRMQSLLDKINKLRKKRGAPPLATTSEVNKKRKKTLKKVVKEPGIVRKSAEKVPIIKRMFRMTPEEENILDSSLSFMASLKYGLFMTNDALTAKEKAAFQGWLDLMSVSLPPEWGLHSLIDELNDNIDAVGQGNEHLLKILKKHPLPRRVWSPSCTRDPKNPQGFSCGFWKLLHTSTVGVAEQRGGLNLVQSGVVDSSTRTFSPAEAADTIREYLAHFFGCTACRNNFISQYDQCSFRRCDRLASDAVSATADDWKQLPLWLWEVHNDVSVRVANEKIARQLENNVSKSKIAKLTRRDEIKHLFPSLEQCFQCFDSTGAWDEDAVFEFLENTYWSAPDPKADKLLQYHDPDMVVSRSGFFWFFVAIILAAAYVMRGRKGDLRQTMNAAVVTGRRMGGKKRSV